MIRKEWKRMLALSMTYIMTLSVAAPVKAAEEELGVPTAETAAEVQETPEQFEARTGYHLSEGYTYVLNNGFVILQADGSPQITPVATPEPTPSETPTPTPTQTPEPTVTPTPAGENTPTPTPGQEGAEPQEVTEQPTGYYSISTVCGSTGDGRGLAFLDSICQQKSGTGESGSGDQRREVTGFPECGKAGRRRYLLYFKKGRRMVLRGIRNRSWFCGEKSASQDRR